MRKSVDYDGRAYVLHTGDDDLLVLQQNEKAIISTISDFLKQ